MLNGMMMMMMIMMIKVTMIMIQGEKIEDKFPRSVYLISLDLPVPPQDLLLQFFLSKKQWKNKFQRKLSGNVNSFKNQ